MFIIITHIIYVSFILVESGPDDGTPVVTVVTTIVSILIVTCILIGGTGEYNQERITKSM